MFLFFTLICAVVFTVFGYVLGHTTALRQTAMLWARLEQMGLMTSDKEKIRKLKRGDLWNSQSS
jgi:hypothetical protein